MCKYLKFLQLLLYYPFFINLCNKKRTPYFNNQIKCPLIHDWCLEFAGIFFILWLSIICDYLKTTCFFILRTAAVAMNRTSPLFKGLTLASGGNIALIINANTMVVDWLTKHISGMEKKMMSTLKHFNRKQWFNI